MCYAILSWLLDAADVFRCSGLPFCHYKIYTLFTSLVPFQDSIFNWFRIHKLLEKETSVYSVLSFLSVSFKPGECGIKISQ